MTRFRSCAQSALLALYCPRLLMALTRSASEGVNPLPRLRFGLVWNVPLLAAGSIINANIRR